MSQLHCTLPDELELAPFLGHICFEPDLLTAAAAQLPRAGSLALQFSWPSALI